MKRIVFAFLCSLLCLSVYSQTVKKDSLLRKLPGLSGIEKVEALNALSGFYEHNDAAEATRYAREALALSEQLKYDKGTADAYNNLSVTGRNQSKFEDALNYGLKALQIAEQNNYLIATAEAYINIANAYLNLNNFEMAVSNYKRTIPIYKQTGDTSGLATVYNNLAVSYDNREILDTALMYYNMAFPIYKNVGNKQYLGLWYMNVGDLYRKQGRIDEALKFQLTAEPLLIEANDQFTLMVLYSGLPYTYMKLNRTDKALEYANKAVEIGIRLKSKRELCFAYAAVADVYEERKDYRNQAEYLIKYLTLKDSIFSEETGHTIAEMQSKYENDKKEKEIELLNKDKALQASEIRAHRNSRIFYAGFGMLAVLLIVVLALAFRNKNKANVLLHKQKSMIEHQKQLVEEKQKEVMDSINYARRLQQAILATPAEISKHLPDNFLIYKPKDIVAGDFYFFETTATHIFYGAADCTGHGVPGAMVSVVCANALTRCVKEFGLSDPGKILDKTRELVLETFAKSSNEVKDGMDISLLCIRKEDRQITWSGANNSLWYITTDPSRASGSVGKSSPVAEALEATLIEIKANKQPIGKTESPKPFTTHEIKHASGCLFYLFTDGYADQFGGAKGKKFKRRQLGEFLFSIHKQPLDKQAGLIDRKFEEWKGMLEQVDDVCIIGIRL